MSPPDKDNRLTGFNQPDALNQSVQKALGKVKHKGGKSLPLMMVNWGEVDAQNFQLKGFNRVQFNAFCQAAGLAVEPATLLDFHKFLSMAQDVSMVYNRALSRKTTQVDSDISLQADALVHINAFLQGKTDSLQPLFEGELLERHTGWVAERLQAGRPESAETLEKTLQADSAQVIPLFPPQV